MARRITTGISSLRQAHRQAAVETTLPAAGNATPAVYEAGVRQFVVIGAGGGKSGAPSGGSYVASPAEQAAN